MCVYIDICVCDLWARECVCIFLVFTIHSMLQFMCAPSIDMCFMDVRQRNDARKWKISRSLIYSLYLIYDDLYCVIVCVCVYVSVCVRDIVCAICACVLLRMCVIVHVYLPVRAQRICMCV